MSDEGSPGDERRLAPREKFRLDKLLTVDVTPSESEPLSLYAFLVDLSEGGLRVNFDRPLEVDSTFGLRFCLTPLSPRLSGSLSVQCRVAWCKSIAGGTFVHGVEFVDPDEEAQEHIAELLAILSAADTGVEPIAHPIWFAARFPDAPEWRRMVSRSISGRGLSFRCADELAVGQELRIRLTFGFNLSSLELPALVEWLGEQANGVREVGCAFGTLEPSQRTRLKEFLARSRTEAEQKDSRWKPHLRHSSVERWSE